MSMDSIHFIKLTFYEDTSDENVCTLAEIILHFYSDYSNFFCNDIKNAVQIWIKVYKTFVEQLRLLANKNIVIHIFKLNTLKDRL